MSHGIKGETSAQGTPKGTTICGIVGVVFGALGLVLSFIPIVNNIAAILGAIGVVLVSQGSVERDLKLAPGESLELGGYRFVFEGAGDLLVQDAQISEYSTLKGGAGNPVMRGNELVGLSASCDPSAQKVLAVTHTMISRFLEQARADGLEVSVVPMALTNLWGSYFSRIEVRAGKNVAMVKPLRRGLFNRVGLEVGEPVAAAAVTPALLQQNVAELLRR